MKLIVTFCILFILFAFGIEFVGQKILGENPDGIKIALFIIGLIISFISFLFLMGFILSKTNSLKGKISIFISKNSFSFDEKIKGKFEINMDEKIEFSKIVIGIYGTEKYGSGTNNSRSTIYIKEKILEEDKYLNDLETYKYSFELDFPKFIKKEKDIKNINKINNKLLKNTLKFLFDITKNTSIGVDWKVVVSVNNGKKLIDVKTIYLKDKDGKDLKIPTYSI